MTLRAPGREFVTAEGSSRVGGRGVALIEALVGGTTRARAKRLTANQKRERRRVRAKAREAEPAPAPVARRPLALPNIAEDEDAPPAIRAMLRYWRTVLQMFGPVAAGSSAASSAWETAWSTRDWPDNRHRDPADVALELLPQALAWAERLRVLPLEDSLREDFEAVIAGLTVVLTAEVA